MAKFVDLNTTLVLVSSPQVLQYLQSKIVGALSVFRCNQEKTFDVPAKNKSCDHQKLDILDDKMNKSILLVITHLSADALTVLATMAVFDPEGRACSKALCT